MRINGRCLRLTAVLAAALLPSMLAAQPSDPLRAAATFRDRLHVAAVTLALGHYAGEWTVAEARTRLDGVPRGWWHASPSAAELEAWRAQLVRLGERLMLDVEAAIRGQPPRLRSGLEERWRRARALLTAGMTTGTDLFEPVNDLFLLLDPVRGTAGAVALATLRADVSRIFHQEIAGASASGELLVANSPGPVTVTISGPAGTSSMTYPAGTSVRVTGAGTTVAGLPPAGSGRAAPPSPPPPATLPAPPQVPVPAPPAVPAPIGPPSAATSEGVTLVGAGPPGDQVGGPYPSPDGQADGAFTLDFEMPGRRIATLMIYNTNVVGAQGNNRWTAVIDGTWAIGVVANGRRVNPQSMPNLGLGAGRYHLYVSGPPEIFRPGNYYVIVVGLDDGRTVQVGPVEYGAAMAGPPPPPVSDSPVRLVAGGPPGDQVAGPYPTPDGQPDGVMMLEFQVPGRRLSRLTIYSTNAAGVITNHRWAAAVDGNWVIAVVDRGRRVNPQSTPDLRLGPGTYLLYVSGPPELFRPGNWYIADLVLDDGQTLRVGPIEYRP